MSPLAVINVAVYNTVPIYGLVNRVGESNTQSQATSTNHHPIHCSLLIANFEILHCLLFCDSYPVRKSLDVSIGFDFAVEYVFASLLILLAGVADGATNPFKILHALQGIYESLII